jgi:hypothetical protein
MLEQLLINPRRLVDYYDDYCPPRFPKARGRRAKQIIAQRYRLPIIRIGNSTLIDEAVADERLCEFALHQELPRRRGRPRAA